MTLSLFERCQSGLVSSLWCLSLPAFFSIVNHAVILSAAKDLLPPSSREVARLAATEGVIRTAEALFEE